MPKWVKSADVAQAIANSGRAQQALADLRIEVASLTTAVNEGARKRIKAAVTKEEQRERENQVTLTKEYTRLLEEEVTEADA